MTPNDDPAAQLSAYLDGELTPEERARVDAALAADPQLRRTLASLQAALAATAALPTPQASPALRRAVLAQVAAPTWAERLALLWSPRALLPVGAAAALALAVVLVNRDGALPSESAAAPVADEEALAMATHLELLEDMELAGLERAEDLDVVTHLDELEATP